MDSLEFSSHERSSHQPKECPEILDEQLGLFERREVSAPGHPRPAGDVVVLLAPPVWETNDLFGICRDTRRQVDAGHRPNEGSRRSSSATGPTTDRKSTR